MSIESVIKNDITAAASFFKDAFGKLQNTNPSSENAQKVQNATAALDTAAKALPALAEEGVDYLLTNFVPQGASYTSLSNQLIDLMIANLQAKKVVANA